MGSRSMSISDEAVEAARVAYRREFPHDENEDYIISLVLSTAAPFIAAQAWDEGFTACAQEHMAQGKDARHPITRKNPHRSDT